jgi:hypothetical protein
VTVTYPPLYEIRQRFDDSPEPDVASLVRHEIARHNFADQIISGQSVAVAVGSRGIRNLQAIVSATVRSLEELSLRPFIMPAMGSHGGATPYGQEEILAHLGITELSVEAPVRSDMETVSIGRLESGAEVLMAKDALEADHLVIINRVKPHTVFRGPIESGLCKMLTVGCGKHEGAVSMHRHGLGESIAPAAKMLLDRVSVLFGVAILENAKEETHTIRLALPHKFIEVDTEFLKIAKSLLPTIPTDDLDILIVDEMGKNISGAGIDPNVIGFWRRQGGPRKPDYRTIVLLDLTPESHGNAVGIGMVDLTTRRVIDKVDYKSTYTNALTSGIWSSAKMPIFLENDRAAIETALSKVPELTRVRMARITNTLRLERLWVSEALLPELRERKDLEISETPLNVTFDENGRLLPFPHNR